MRQMGRGPSLSIALAILLFLGSRSAEAGTPRTWTGTNSGLWSIAANWGGTAPSPGDDLFFPEGASNAAMTNDFAPGFLANSLNFQAATTSYSLGGSLFVLGPGGIVVAPFSGSPNHAINAPMDLGAGNLTLTVSGALDINGAISGTGGFTKVGGGRLTLSGTNSYSGATTLNGGLLLVNGSQPASPITMNVPLSYTDGMWGTGTVGPLTVTSGFLNPPFGRLGILTVSGPLSLGPGSGMYPVIAAPAAGSGYGQIQVVGPASLGGQLNLSLNPYALRGNIYTLVTATGGLSGTFTGLAEGALITSNLHDLAVSYAANGGKDFTLTDHGVTPNLSITAAPNPSCPGVPVLLTAKVPGYTSPWGISPGTGSVTFTDGASTLAVVSLDGTGTATFTTSTLSSGSHAIGVTYPGNAAYNSGSASVAGGVSVGPDTQAPAVTPPADIVVPQTVCCGAFGGATSAGSPALATFLGAATAADNCTASPTPLPPQVGGVDVTGGTCFEVGTTAVTFRFQDAASNVGSASANVTVQMFGDLNLDGLIDSGDLVVLRGYLNFAVSPGSPPFLAPLSLADVNHDTSVDSSDLVLMRAYLNLAVGCLAP